MADTTTVAVDGSRVQADASPARGVDGPVDLPDRDATRAVRDYLEELARAAPVLDGVRRSRPKRLSATGPVAALSRKYGRAVHAYDLNAMLDTTSGIVPDVQAAPERYADEPKAIRQMIARLNERHDVTPNLETGDKA